MTNKQNDPLDSCGCCEGVEALTPLAIANRPGLEQLAYRVGTHATFLETMKARLSSGEFPALQGLTSREGSDPAIAWLDACTTVADVLSFYDERIANEGYLRTAGERRSILELARLVGYKLRPGVAASVYLAFTLDKGYAVEIPAGTGTQSVPSPGELPQPFETAEPLAARAEWNELKPRLTRPQEIHLTSDKKQIDKNVVYFRGTDTGLKPNLPLLFGFGSSSATDFVHRWIASVEVEREANRTKVTLVSGSGMRAATLPTPSDVAPTSPFDPKFFLVYSERFLRMYTAFRLPLNDYKLRISPSAPLAAKLEHIDLLSIKAAPFAHNAPLKANLPPGSEGGAVTYTDWTLDELSKTVTVNNDEIPLDQEYRQLVKDSVVLITRAGETAVRKVEGVESIYATACGLAQRVTRIKLVSDVGQPWLDRAKDLADLRQTSVYFADSGTHLKQADAPIDPVAEPVMKDRIELAGFLSEMEPGRLLLVAGVELKAIKDASGNVIRYEATGVWQTELVTLKDIEHASVSTLILNKPLEYIYKRDTVTIYGNVVKATHGATRRETLGSGDGNQPWQSFTLQQSPLTYLLAPTPAGTQSTLEVRVNDVRWHEAERLFDQSPTDHVFLAQADEKDQVTVSFGDGQHGARLPTGVENVTAVYRTGLGKGGNVAAGQIRLLTSKPLGVKSVTNPQSASGGADGESLDQARQNASLAVMALDRLVSVQDYADFARTFAGIGKASAVRLPLGRRHVLHLTIAGVDDIPIKETDELYRNLLKALRQFGDPAMPVQVAMRSLKLLVIHARVRLLPDYLWTAVEPQLRTALLATFGFARRDLGQDVWDSEVVSTIQAVPGVDYVDLEALDAVSKDRLDRLLESDVLWEQPESVPPRIAAQLAYPVSGRSIAPAELVYLTADINSTILLKEIPV